MTNPQFVAVYITTSSKKEAEKIGELIIKERLCGCVNIIPSITSIYWWKNKIEKNNESVIIVKTRAALVNKLINFVKKHHSYDVPCINVMPILQGNPEYLKWIEKETIK